MVQLITQIQFLVADVSVFRLIFFYKITLKSFVKMKKLEKIKLNNYKEILVNAELNQLKGGSGDVNNNNSFNACNCDYNNQGAINNANTVYGCSCHCI